MIKNFIVLFVVLFPILSFPFSQTNLLRKLENIPKTWKAGFNSYFKQMTLSQIKLLMGTIQTPNQFKLPLKNIPILKSLPTNFDSRQFWPNCSSIKEVRDQSTCGSCWAFAAVESMSDRICIFNGQRVQTRISAENLLSCCGIQCGRGCDGGSPHAAWNYYKKTGIVTGWLYKTSQWCQPYTFAPCDHHTEGKYEPCGKVQPTPKCEKSCQSSYNVSYHNDHYFAKIVYSVPSKVEEIQSQIMANGPVEASFTVYSDFLTYKSGVYHHVEGTKLGGHSVKIIGWGEENKIPYWLVANSWNEDWGDKGFFKIKRGSNECGIEKQVLAGIPKISNNIQSE